MIILNRLRATRFKQLDNIDLRFPDSGTVLIEGHNEAGKSSLFEAVLFALYGRPLLSDREYKIANLKQYGAENMEVILDFAVEGRPFSLTRRFTERHSAKLTMPGLDDDESETINILSEIDKRVREELRLSPEALLNTCFVEQKHLERLEDMSPPARQAAINELLNLKVLTRLQTEFKVSGEDRSALTLQKERVAIAELDAEWPKLQVRAEAAHRCWLWVKWRDEESHTSALQSQIEDTQTLLQSLAQRQEEIEKRQHEIAALRERLDTLRGALTLSAQAWQSAQQELNGVELRVVDLQTLQAELPAREERQQEHSQLAAQLEQLETLERQALPLQQQCEAKRAALEAHDQTQNTFEKSERSLEELESERATAQQKLSEAEAAQAARQASHRREGQLNLWLAQLEKFCDATRREAEVEAQLQAAQQTAAKMNESNARLQTLQEVRTLRASDVQIERALKEVQRELEIAERDLMRETERATQYAERESERQALEARLGETEKEHAAALRQMRQAEQRVALEGWLQAHAVDADENAGVASLEDLAVREEQLQNSAQSALQVSESATRAKTPAFGIVGAGGVALVAAFVLGATSPLGMGLIILALALIAFGVWRIAATTRTVQTHQEEYTRLRSETDALAGERRALEAQSHIIAQNAARRYEQQLEARRSLESLGVSIPGSPTEAQNLLAQFPELSIEAARRVLFEHESAMHAARAQHTAAMRALQSSDNTPARDRSELRRLISQLQEKSATLKTEQGANSEKIAAFVSAANSEELRSAMLDESKLETFLDAARIEANAVQTASQSLPQQELAAQNARELSASLKTQVLNTACVLGLTADNDSEVAIRAEEQAQRELGEFQAEQKELPDETLQSAVVQARTALSVLETRISVELAQQEQRRVTLEATPRAALLADFETSQKQWREAQNEIERLQAVRETIEARKLPETGSALHAFVATQQQVLQHTREQVALLPAKQQEAIERRANVEASRLRFAEIWQRILPEAGLPTDAEMALKALPLRASQIEEELAQSNTEGLQQQTQQLQTQTREAHQSLATLGHQLENAQKRIEHLKSRLQADDTESLRQFAARFEMDVELESAPQNNAADWEREWQARREAIAHNRSTRAAQAKAIDISHDVLGLAQEREKLAEAEQQIAVKRRAAEIVEMTRASIVKRVMPMTMQNIRQLLPLLTEGRYRDAEWDEVQDKIMIYDAEARAHVRKHTFSGGARDQISLALRLAFALATLPGEHNIRPGFLFLDEPLSSFDRARTQALVDLLTRGLIRRNFQQIFLVSHSESFDPALFDFRLRLEGGRVVESTLPT